jgi:DNA repair exonuclease SbcCD ATPase subunit
MLNRIVIINSELYAKAAIYLGDCNSVQLAAESNVGKSSFLNTLNFLYITDKEQMRFENNRKLSDSMKHYFENSFQSFIIFEIFNNGYYCILVKATPENTIEYYKIDGEYNETYFIQKAETSFAPKKWDKILTEIATTNSINLPKKLTNDDLYNLIYNSDKNKNSVVQINNKVKRKGRSFSNSFTDIYKYLIKTSEISERAFKNALLVADNKQDVSLNVFTKESSDEIENFENKKAHLSKLQSVKSDIETLKELNNQFISKETILGKLKNTFFKKFNDVHKELSDQIAEFSPLLQEIKAFETKINKTLKEERDALVTEKANKTTEKNRKNTTKGDIEKQLAEIEGYEPTSDNLMFQGLLLEYEKKDGERKYLESQLTQSEQSKFSAKQVEGQIKIIEGDITKLKNSIEKFDNLLYQNISDSPEITKQVYSYLNSNVANLDKSKISKKITKADLPMTIFDGKIDVSEIKIENPKTVKDLQEELNSKNIELSDKKKLFEALTNKEKLQKQVDEIVADLETKKKFIEKIKQKPELQQQKIQLKTGIKELEERILPDIEQKIRGKDQEIEDTEAEHSKKVEEKNNISKQLSTYKQQYNNLQEKTDIYEIEEIIEKPFEKLYEEFNRHYQSFAGEDGIRAKRKQLKGTICSKLNSDTEDIKQFIRETDEEYRNFNETEKAINALLDSLSAKIGNTTFNFLQQFNDFKTFVTRSYNKHLAEYPVSNIQSVKVLIDENSDLIKELEKISKLKFEDGFDFDNSIDESKKAFEKQLENNNGKAISIDKLFNIVIEITKVSGETEKINLAEQVQSNGTDIILKLYLFLNIIKDLVVQNDNNKVVIYIDELGSIGRKNLKNLLEFCEKYNFVPLFASIRNIEGIQKYYQIKEQKPKITFGELQSFPVEYRNAE